ncbi:Uncharacterized protein family UPF0005 containing protein [Aphelenchoides avenae]|nr:Uncharacterized protein family UPF0005 containing protein [Aphelenchus avenae]
MMMTAFHDIETVLVALLVTTLCCTAIIVFAAQTKYDFTSWIGIMCVASVGLFLFGIIAVVAYIFFHVRWLYLIYAFVAAAFFMIFLAIDVQMILGGRQHEIHPEEYIYAAVQVFLDILYIFWMCLALSGSASRN